jgi:hypothetical protein
LFRPSVDCCNDLSHADCNRTCDPLHVGQIYPTRWSIKSSYIASPITERSLRGEIDSDRPVEVAWMIQGGGNHLIIVWGYKYNPYSGGLDFLINDPRLGYGEFDHSDLKTATGKGYWILTWTGLEP